MIPHSPYRRRNASYLRQCVRISLTKRRAWILLSAILTALLAVALHLHTAQALAASVTMPLLTSLAIALDSWRRHLND